MTSFTRALAVVLFLVLALAVPASAGLNNGVVWSMSWSPDSPVYKVDCAPVNTIYVTFRRTGGLTFAGGSILLNWTSELPEPVHPELGAAAELCITYIQSVFPHSTTTCTALNRGATTVLTEDANSFDSYGYLTLSWINTTTTTGCDSGLVAEIQIESDTCVDCGWGFSGNAEAFDGTSSDGCYGGTSLILGNGPSIPVRPTTWGVIKELMRR